jgi:hypothetical protein
MEDRHEILGGEFDVDIQGLKYRQPDNSQLEGVFKYASGRSALYYILLDAKERYGVTQVLFPDYLCSSILVAAKEADLDVVFYPLNTALELDEKSFANLYDEKSAVLLINYFGLKDLSSQIAAIRTINKAAIIIEDDVQAYYEFIKPLNSANYKFTSLRKTLACPDGGLVKTEYTLGNATASNKFHQYKLAGSILKSLRQPEYYDDEVYLSMFEKGEDMIDAEIAAGMSEMSSEILSKLDTDRLGIIRKRNARTILSGLESLGIAPILPVSEDAYPLFIPIYLEDRKKVRKYMFQHNVFCPVHWPLEGMNVKKGAEMAEHELSIIVDQRYTNRDMEYILELLEKSIK